LCIHLQNEQTSSLTLYQKRLFLLVRPHWPPMAIVDQYGGHCDASLSTVEGKAVPYSLEEFRRGANLPSVSHWARRWIKHWSLWRMATATPDLRLPSQP